MNHYLDAFWSIPVSELFQRLQTTSHGLSSDEAKERFIHYGANLLKPKKRSDALTLLFSQFKSPIILILLFAAGLSFILRDSTDALIILAIVIVSGLLGFWQEKGAADALEKLLAIVQIKVTVLRDGIPREVPSEEIVPGDIVILSAGAGIPGDCLIIESKDLFIDEASLTGETYPVEKMPGVVPEETALAKQSNTLFMGTHLVSGTAKAAVVRTAINTEFGKVSERMKLRPPETEFEHGIRRFGYFLMEITLNGGDDGSIIGDHVED